MEKPERVDLLVGITRAEDYAEYTKIENKKIEESAKGSDQTNPQYKVEPKTLEEILDVAGDVRDLAFQPGVTDHNLSDWGEALKALFPVGKPVLDESSAKAIFTSLDGIKQQAEQAAADH